MIITTKLEFDAGHRIPNHKSECRNLHGHRYILEVSISGEIINDNTQSEYGMVLDFKDVKSLLKKTLIESWDHAFLVFKEDKEVLNFLNSLPDHKTVILDKVPTAENLAIIAKNILDHEIKAQYGEKLTIKKIKLFETPNNWAEINA